MRLSGPGRSSPAAPAGRGRRRAGARRPRLGSEVAAWLACVIAALVPTMWVSWQAPVARGIALPALAILALAVIASQAAETGERISGKGGSLREWITSGRHRVRSDLRGLIGNGGPKLPVILLMGWAVICATRAPAGDFARGELLRLAGGVAVYLAVARAARHWERARRLMDALVGAVIAATVMAFANHSGDRQGPWSPLSGSFGNPQLLAAFLLQLVPLVLLIAIAAKDPRRRTVAQVAAVLALAAMTLTQTRSAWVGGLVAFAVLAALMGRLPRRRRRRRDRRPELAAGVLALSALGLLVCRTDLVDPVSARAATLARLGSDQGAAWRVRQWRVALALVRARPLTGYGLGSYPLAAAPRLPQPIPLDVARAAGPNLALNAHNLYLQTWAETGAVGLGLYLWVLAAFFAAGLPACRRKEQRTRTLVLIACMAAVAGQAVDALANPAYQFMDVSLFFWAILGLGGAMAARPPEAACTVPSCPGRQKWWLLRPAAALTGAGALVAGSVAGAPPPANVAEYVPFRSFQVQALTVPGYLSPTLLPGECVEMRALGTTERGEERDATAQCRFSRAGGTAPADSLEQLPPPHANLFCLPTGVPATDDGRTVEMQGTLDFNGQTLTARSSVLTLSVPNACPGVLVTVAPQVLPPTGEMVEVRVHYVEAGVRFQRLQRVEANEPLAQGDVRILENTRIMLRAISTLAGRRIYTLQYRFRDRSNRAWVAPVQVYVR